MQIFLKIEGSAQGFRGDSKNQRLIARENENYSNKKQT